jgi:hypothetical protein
MNDTGDVGARKRRTRGIFQRHEDDCSRGRDCGCDWWTRYADEHGNEHREKVGPKALAIKVYQKRKNEVQERRFFPERIRRRDVLLKDAIAAFQRDQSTADCGTPSTTSATGSSGRRRWGRKPSARSCPATSRGTWRADSRTVWRPPPSTASWPS